MSDYQLRLEQFLSERGQPIRLAQLTPDASIREYFRVSWNNHSAIACVYPENFDPREHAYLDVTNLFLQSQLPVAKIYDFDGAKGVILLEDLGDAILRPLLERCGEERKEELIDEAIKLIARIQAATHNAYTMNSVAAKLKFDVEKLTWELDFFRTHYFETYKRQPLSVEKSDALTREFAEIAGELELRAAVLCHRDFHAANLMIDRENKMRIIDHQDARIGAASYDLVSLLLDRVTESPSRSWIREKRLLFLTEREKLGLRRIDPDEFAAEFRLQTIQRCLKAIGTFSYQSSVRGKIHFVQFIKPMFEIVLRAAQNLDRFPTLQMIIGEQFSEKDS